MNPIRVMVVEHHLFFRGSLVHWLNQQPPLTCCGEAGTVAAARRTLAHAQPDVLLLDLHLPDGDALEFVRELSETHSGLRILGLVREEHSFGRDALPAGIRACVAKTEATETLLSAIIAVLGGDVALLAASPASLAAAARRAAGGSRPSSS